MRVATWERWLAGAVVLGGLMGFLSGCGGGSGTEANGGQTVAGPAATTSSTTSTPSNNGGGGGGGGIFVYAINNNKTVSGFKLNTTTGVLTAVSTTNLANPGATAGIATVNGQQILIVGEGAASPATNVQSFLIKADGTLALADSKSVNAQAAVNAEDVIQVSASTSFAYLLGDNSTNNVSPFAVAANGTLTAGAAASAGPGGFVVPNSATHFIGANTFLDVGLGTQANSIAIFQVDTGSGALTSKGSFTLSATSSPNALASTGTQLFATTGDATNNIIPLSQDGTTGALSKGTAVTMAGTNPPLVLPTGILAGTVSGATNALVTNEGTSNNVIPYAFVGGNLVQGTVATAGGAGNLPAPLGLAAGSGFAFVGTSGATNNVTSFSVNAMTGVLTVKDVETAGATGVTALVVTHPD